MYEVKDGHQRDSEASLQGGKLILKGIQSVTMAEGQYKYGDEVIIQVYNQAGSVVKKDRVNENYDRIQIFFTKSIFLDICKMILEDRSNGQKSEA